MQVKGTAYLARQALVIAAVGEARWRTFLAEVAAVAPFVTQPVMPISRLPVTEFLALNDAMVRTFYGGKFRETYIEFGENSAVWALKNQLKGLFAAGEGARFLQFAVQVFRGYFDGGSLVTAPVNGAWEMTITGVPEHPYFEHSITSFAEQGLKELGHAPTVTMLEAFSNGDHQIRRRFAF